ncbi:hypothetical protein P389DRAFT_139235 [Cystobasidium minutum MCA 4210]|uniref:uncharacterized protein n=1 Tax=Cystobasidium minutum MCA 4210 TaxID=1397322 RepID=UPI0034CE8F7E|eukprot:jgi/Rhomi1/139235/e_gw1.1.392.1
MSSEEDSVHIQTIEQAMTRLKQLDQDKNTDEWEKVMHHHRDVTVYVRKSVVNVAGKQKKVPLFRGDKFIAGFSPEQVFEVVGRRSLWDDWYDSGNLVADLNNSTSMTYMNMHIPGTARPRDLALIERVEASMDGTIHFAATSIETNKVPQVHGRTRAQMILNGWILKPFEQNGHAGTWCFYYLQVDPHGLTPFPLATKMVSKRLVHIYKIEDYLKKNGMPRSAGTGQTVHQQQQQGASNGNGRAVAAAGAGSSAGAGLQSTKQGEESGGMGLPPQIPFDKSHASANSVIQAKENLERLLSSPSSSWEKAVDPQGNPLYTQKVQESDLPIMKGEASMPSEVKTEQVLGTILSPAARRIWNEYLQYTEIVESITGLEQCIHEDVYKGIHPHMPGRTYTLAQGVFRSDPTSDNGDIICAATSSSGGKVLDIDESASSLRSTLDYSGWQISSSTSNSDKVHLVNAIKLNLDKPDLPEFVKRILLTAYAGASAKVGECIKKYGHPPFFLRWTAGKAILLEETEDSDLANGNYGWKIGAKGKGTEASQTEQIAWLQYSSIMYPNGISLRVNGSSSPLKAAKVEGFTNTIQVAFSTDLSADGTVLEGTRHNGSSPSDVLWNGSPLTQTVSPPRGGSGGRKAVAKANGAGAAGVVSTSERQKESPSASAGPDGIRQRSTTTSQQLSKVSETATDLATVHRLPRDSEGRHHLPDDAMLILTKEVYFTRTQMGLISVLLLIVWLAARYL